MITESQTIREAKDFLHENMEAGCQCPACGQNVKLYKRPINSGCARFLIGLYRLTLNEKKTWGTKGWSFFTNDEIRKEALLNSKGLAYGIIRHWELAERAPASDDKKKTSGQWKLTTKGYFFVTRQIRIPKRALIYNNSLIGFGPEDTDIQETLGEDYNYKELMQ